MKYFNCSEFDSPDEVGSGENMDKLFLAKLDYARGLAGIPFHINSGYRTAEHNKAVGGVYNSSHTKGLAADIRCVDDASRSTILQALIAAGFDRFGIAKTFIHVDNDTSKNSNRIWVY